MNVEYKYKGITNIFLFSIAQEQIKTSFSAPLQNMGQKRSRSARLLWMRTPHIDVIKSMASF